MIILGCYILATAIGGWHFQWLYAIFGFGADLLIASKLRREITVTETDKYSFPLWRMEKVLDDIKNSFDDIKKALKKGKNK